MVILVFRSLLNMEDLDLTTATKLLLLRHLHLLTVEEFPWQLVFNVIWLPQLLLNMDHIM